MIEKLIADMDGGHNSLNIVNDRLRTAHRVFCGVFHKVRAAIILDRHLMFVLPEHGRTIRHIEASQGHEQLQLISDSIKCFHRMRKFRVHMPTRLAVARLLKAQLSYRLPYDL